LLDLGLSFSGLSLQSFPTLCLAERISVPIPKPFSHAYSTLPFHRFGQRVTRPSGLPPEDFAKALLVKEKFDAGMPMTQIAKMEFESILRSYEQIHEISNVVNHPIGYHLILELEGIKNKTPSLVKAMGFCLFRM
tara:strand:+ start:3349 stop:3753 length:405 start_codon:yes stop_codon:yes gene_type:complete